MDVQSTKPNLNAPTVAVVMATFNRAHLISEAIDSLLNQTRPPDEFIVVNDGSTDDTAKVVRRYGTKIKYIEKSNGGKSSALNLALPRVESAYAWIFDDDDVALPHALEAHLDFLSKHPEYDFSYSTNYLFSGNYSEDALQRGKLKSFPPRSGEDYFLWIMESSFLPTLMQGMLIPTRCFRAAGAFDEKLIRGQDADMLLRIARRFRAGSVGQPTFAERLHGGERGSANEHHPEADRYRVWRQYKRQIFEKVRVSLALEEYLPKSDIAPTSRSRLAPAETRRALLQRAVIMATHGLFPEAVDDFRECVDSLGLGKHDPTDKECDHVSALAHVRGPGAVPPSEYYRGLGTLSRGRRGLLKAAMRGLYWSIVREVRNGHFVHASRLASLGASMASAYTGIPAVGRRRFRAPT